uniref:Uncharacterized protein n=1 Tax=Globisporangium ultimum (strain ATCC 200006 / CBS 805.95 / DAOM BR144) TaxID=431595 RepID=K3W9U7_GLOUD
MAAARSPEHVGRKRHASNLMASVNLQDTLVRAGSGTTYHIAGWRGCSFFQKACDVGSAMQVLYPDHLQFTVHEFADRDAFRAWLDVSKDDFATHFGATSPALTHTSSPFVWSNAGEFVGGCDALLATIRGSIS